MAALFISLYDFFRGRRRIFWLVFIVSLLTVALTASRIRFEEDITKFFPDDARVEQLNYVFQNSKFVERIVVMVSIKDSAMLAEPDSLVEAADTLTSRINRDLKPFISRMITKIDDQIVLDLFATIYQSLPVFLDDDDYHELDSIVNPQVARQVLEANYRQLISPAGIVVKQIISKDPLGISFLPLRKLKQLQYDENFELYDGYIVTRDRRHLVFFLLPVFPPDDTGNNSKLLEQLDKLIQEISDERSSVAVSYFGAPVVAVGNARQLRNDSMLTLSLVTIFLAVFLIAFFRKKRVPVLVFIPVIFGALFALCCVYLIKGKISILAIAAGSVILGIAVNYSLHFLSHLRHTHNVKEVINDLVRPMTMGSATTIVAFFCLQFANAAVLRDLGLFAGFSLIGAALCSLIFLPHLIPQDLFKKHERRSWFEQTSFSGIMSHEYLAILIVAVTPAFLYFAQDVKFNSDMSKLNFMTSDIAKAQERLETLTRSSLTSLYVVSTGKDLQTALAKNETVTPVLQHMQEAHVISKFASVSTFMISDSLQRERINKWNEYWVAKRESLIEVVRTKGRELKFSEQVIGNFEQLLSKDYSVADSVTLNQIRAAFFEDYIIEKNGQSTVISLVNVQPSGKERVYDELKEFPVHAFDRQILTNLLVEYVNADFKFIVTFTAVFVFLALLILYGRLELTLITFVPMMITWIWILGIMALVGIEFNIINVMVSTFIFGLGDDYSIFTMDGLLQQYRVGKKSLASIRTSIFLSAVTTVAGLGVLIFAKHPALQSIAAISIIGIICVFIMSQTIEPVVFHWLVTNRTQKGLSPMTTHGILRTTFTYSLFVIGAIFLTVVGSVLRIVPFRRRQIKVFFHKLLSAFARAIIYVEPTVGKNILGRTSATFSTPQVIIANHTSFLDILLTIMLHHKLILVTNTWVWNSPIFGSVVRLADYYPSSEGSELGGLKLKDRFDEGYSLVIFPEGTRSHNGLINRFHKGAFYIAEKYALPILPLLIHGAADAIPKGSFYLNTGTLTLKFLPPIQPFDETYGEHYSERTKKIAQYFRSEFVKLKETIETPDYFSHKLISNYIYKGPVLEWYLRIKLKLERNYAPFHNLLPRRGSILDLGCGYGFLCYMLQFLSGDRIIVGVDYDEEKIDVAARAYSKSGRLNFYAADVTKFTLQKYDGIVISDVLHYLSPESQEVLVERAIDALNHNGILLIREGNTDFKKRHRGTQITEFFSVKLLKFNKSVNSLNFLSGERIKAIVQRKGLSVEISDDAKYTSNVIFVIRKTGDL